MEKHPLSSVLLPLICIERAGGVQTPPFLASYSLCLGNAWFPGGAAEQGLIHCSKSGTQQDQNPTIFPCQHGSCGRRGKLWAQLCNIARAMGTCSQSRQELHLAHHTGRQMKHRDGDLLEVRSWIQTQTSKLNTFRKPYAANPGSKEKPSVCSEPSATPTHGNGDGARWGPWKVSLVSYFIIISRLSS